MAAVGALLAELAGPGAAPGSEQIWALDDCSTQRNLSDAGRREARQIGLAFRARGVVVDRVLASPWCRCVETARLAFGSAEIAPALSNLFEVREMQALVGERHSGGNLVLVSHPARGGKLRGDRAPERPRNMRGRRRAIWRS